ncbi:unnamed protein product, partial [Discosporangium mesarthrocarpum]
MVSFDDENFSFWDPFKTSSFNASAVVLPVASKALRSAPMTLLNVATLTGLRWFLPPPALGTVNVAYIAAAMVRSQDVETFCKGEAHKFLMSPSLHFSLLGSALRVVRFRLWRRLIFKAALFRMRNQLRFRRLRRLSFVPSSPTSSLERIFRDAAQASFLMQGLLPAAFQELEVMAGGLDLPFWPQHCPPPSVSQPRDLRLLDREIAAAYGGRVHLASTGRRLAAEKKRAQHGLLGWKRAWRLAGGGLSLLRHPGGRGKERGQRARNNENTGETDETSESVGRTSSGSSNGSSISANIKMRVREGPEAPPGSSGIHKAAMGAEGCDAVGEEAGESFSDDSEEEDEEEMMQQAVAALAGLSEGTLTPIPEHD